MDVSHLSTKEVSCGVGCSIATSIVAFGTTYAVMRIVGALFGSKNITANAGSAAAVVGGLSALPGLLCLGAYAAANSPEAVAARRQLNAANQQLADTIAHSQVEFAQVQHQLEQQEATRALPENRFQQAVFFKNLNEVRAVLDEGYDPLTSDTVTQWLMYPEILEEVLKHGVHPDEIQWNGDSALIQAVLMSKKDLVGLLLKHGADPCLVSESKYEWKESPLHLAASFPSPKILQCLLKRAKDRGADVDVKNSQGHTPLYLALKRDNVENAQLLLKNGANPTADEIDDAFVEGLGPKAKELITQARTEPTQAFEST